jgi:hypothetical protein
MERSRNPAAFPEIDDGGELVRQAAICRAMDSPLTASVLEASKRVLAAGIRTSQTIADWKGNRGHAAVALRLAGGLHWLARQGTDSMLSDLYRNRSGDFDAVIANTFRNNDDFLAGWLTSPPKTNEVGRAAAIMAALLVVSERFGLPFELIELGSSAGLNLNLHRYAYDLGGVKAGDLSSDVLIQPEWRGLPPPNSLVDIQSTRGVDTDPIDLADPANTERLMAYVWADRDDRLERLSRVMAVARSFPPQIDVGDAVTWIEGALAEPQAEGIVRGVFHSIVLQYISDEGRSRIREIIHAAGAAATEQRPLAWISFEWNETRGGIELRLTMWPGGEERLLAASHAHGQWIDWMV